MDTAVSDLDAMLARELKPEVAMLVQGVDEDFRIVADFLDAVGAEAGQGVLRPVRGFDVEEVGEVFVRLCAEDLE